MKNISIKFLTPPDLIKDAEDVRTKVFQVEQKIGRALDFDGLDESATHIVVYEDKIPVGTGRMRTIEKGKVKIERVAVLSALRGQGIGKLIMQAIDEYLLKNQTEEATLDAQLHAKGFYENLGYRQDGEVFEEVGIPHVVMVKRIK